MRAKLGIMVCENLRREAGMALRSGGFDDVRLLSFPSDCIRPQTGWGKITSSVAGAEGDFSRLEIIASLGCLPHGSPPDSVGPCRVHRVEQCAHLLVDKGITDTFLAEGAYLLTPGWLAHWRQYFSDWGFDQNTASQFFGEFTSRLVLLDTGVDESSADRLKEMASFLGLPFEIVPVGLDFFRLRLENIALRWRLAEPETERSKAKGEANPQSSDYAAAFDLMDSIAGIGTEPEVIDRVLDVFTMLFAAGSLAYIPFGGGNPGGIKSRPEIIAEAEISVKNLDAFTDEYAWTESDNGFRLLMAHHGERLGVLEVDGIAFPEHKERYLNLALTVGRLCSLVIFNARTYEKMKQAEEALDAQRERLAVTLRSIGDGLIATDTEGRVVLLSQVAEQLTGWTNRQAAGRPLSEVLRFVKVGTREPAENPVLKAFQSGAVAGRDEDSILVSRDGTERIIAGNASPVLDKSGKDTGAVLVFRDVTQRRAEARRLRGARQYSERLIQAANAMIIGLDAEGNVSVFNEAAEKVTGYKRAELTGRNWFEVLAPRDRYPGIWRAFAAGAADGLLPEVAESPILTKSGEERRISWRNSVIREGDTIAGAISFGLDITEQRKTEDELRKLSRAVEQSPSTVVITDTSGAIEYVNPKFSATTGYTREEAIGQNPRILKSGEMPAEGYKQLWDTITCGREWRGEFHNKRKNGELYWEFASISPVRDQSGTITHFLAVKEDITARKEAEEAIARLAAIVESSEDAIISKSLDGVILSWNPGAERLYGYSAKEVVGKSVSILEPPDRPSDLAEILGKLRRGERIQHYEVHRIRKDGTLIEVSVSLSVVKGPDGKVMGASTIAGDITERKLGEEDIKRLHRNLERRAVELDSINTELEAFSFSVSHDLRAPLMSLDGFSQALLEDYDEILDDQG
ncbi:MAG: PAS domain S-box protein, partial [Dehalococcoidia bacterium]|nr:PAS domain S-box protein [Dehalococcoidia bacterium]